MNEKKPRMMPPAVLMILGTALVLLGTSSARADHEPQTYSYAGAKSRSQAVEFPPSPRPRPLAREAAGTDPLIDQKMNDLLDGMLSPALAGLAVHDDRIVYERYRRGDDRNLYPAWSMTKSLVSMTVGHALCEGHIKNLDDLAQVYVPGIEGTIWGRATLRQLLTMRSGSPRQGLDRGGDYLYAGTSSGLEMVKGLMAVKDAARRFDSLADSAPAGTRFTYANMDTDTLGLVVAAATGKPFAKYLEETVLAGARLEHPSVIHLDREGHAVTHAYFFASLRDYARLGLYALDLYQGKAGNPCLKGYMAEALKPHTEARNSINRSSIGYGYQFWLDPGFGQSPGESVRMSGHQGQEVFINLRTGKVAVLLGWRSSLRDKSMQPGSVVEWMVR